MGFIVWPDKDTEAQTAGSRGDGNVILGDQTSVLGKLEENISVVLSNLSRKRFNSRRARRCAMRFAEFANLTPVRASAQTMAGKANSPFSSRTIGQPATTARSQATTAEVSIIKPMDSQRCYQHC